MDVRARRVLKWMRVKKFLYNSKSYKISPCNFLFVHISKIHDFSSITSWDSDLNSWSGGSAAPYHPPRPPPHRRPATVCLTVFIPAVFCPSLQLHVTLENLVSKIFWSTIVIRAASRGPRRGRAVPVFLKSQNKFLKSWKSQKTWI